MSLRDDVGVAIDCFKVLLNAELTNKTSEVRLAAFSDSGTSHEAIVNKKTNRKNKITLLTKIQQILFVGLERASVLVPSFEAEVSSSKEISRALDSLKNQLTKMGEGKITKKQLEKIKKNFVKSPRYVRETICQIEPDTILQEKINGWPEYLKSLFVSTKKQKEKEEIAALLYASEGMSLFEYMVRCLPYINANDRTLAARYLAEQITFYMPDHGGRDKKEKRAHMITLPNGARGLGKDSNHYRYSLLTLQEAFLEAGGLPNSTDFVDYVAEWLEVVSPKNGTLDAMRQRARDLIKTLVGNEKQVTVYCKKTA